MKRLTLLLKIRLMFAAVLLGLCAVAGLTMWGLSRDAVRRQVQQDVGLASAYLKSYLERERSNLTIQTRLIAEQPALRAIVADSEVDDQTLRDRLEFYRRSVGAGSVAFRNSKGQFRAGTTGLADKSNWSEDRVHGLTAEGQAGFDTLPNGFLLSTSVPITIGAQVLGVVTGYSLIGDGTAQKLAGQLGVQVAFVVSGRVAASSIETPNGLPPGSDFHRVELNGEQYGAQQFELAEPTTGQQIAAVVMRSEEQATIVYRRLTKYFLLLLPVAMLMAMVLASYLAKGITRPLDSVVLAASSLQRGDWPERLSITSNDELGFLQSVFNDTVEALQASEQRLLAMIDTDPLTGLENHRRFKESLEHEVARAQESGEGLSLLLIDIDHFKEYNDANGFATGDLALTQVARAIEAATPEFAAKARFGGEEFAVLLPRYNLERSEETADTIRQAITSWVKGVTVSIGCAQFGVNTAKPEGLVIATELALARAKQLGRDRVCRFDSVPGADANADPYQLHKFLQDASLSTIQALAAAVDAKDAYTKGHSLRVAQYAAELAAAVGATESEVDLIFRTGTLHDVGKIGVPDSILKKPGRLEPEERTIMETHPVLGELIVRKAPQLEETIPGVRHHHEAWDGTGYPDGLAGEEIPYVARVLAVADTFDAMTSDRPYRKGLDLDIALSEIAKGAGSQFDPELANAFVKLWNGRTIDRAA